MRTVFSHVAIALSLAISGLALVPAGDAVPPSVVLGVVADSVSTGGFPDHAEGRRLGASDLKVEKLREFDAVVLEKARFDAAWSDPDQRAALKRFVRDDRAVVVTDDRTVFDGFGVSHPDGTDTPGSESSDAMPIAARAYGAYRSESGAWEFATFHYGATVDRDRDLASDAARWLLTLAEYRERHADSIVASAADDANWQYWGSATYSYTWSPYGKLAYTARFYYAISDSSSAYDWWVVHMTHTTTPGTYLWGNDWRTNMAWTTGDQNELVASNQLVDAGPGSIDSTLTTTTLNFEVGMTAGVDGAPITSKRAFSYSVDDMIVVQAADYTAENQYIRHEYGYGSGPANGVFSSKPAWSVRVNEATCLKVPWTNKGEWLDYGTTSYYTTWITSWREVCKT